MMEFDSLTKLLLEVKWLNQFQAPRFDKLLQDTTPSG